MPEIMGNVELLLTFYEKMLLARAFENTLFELAKKGTVRGSVHFGIGEEATSVGTCMAISPHDYILPTHRGHGQELAKGTDPGRLLAEIIGKETGVCGGRGGTMHVFDRQVNNLGSQGILGAQFPISIGVGLAIKLQEIQNTTVLCYFGDGTSNIGTFYEVLNISCLWSLPIVFVCVNNGYGMGTRYEQSCTAEICRKAELFGMLTACVDGNDIEQVYARTKEIVTVVKSEMKPALIELRTYRIMGHSAFDTRPYRTGEEVEEWKKKDPIDRLLKRLAEERVDRTALQAIEERVAARIIEAEKFALDSAYPAYAAGIQDSAICGN
jgi:TPP-dependent pyruvate/acetoin dehydrogenase alpha subunit